MAEFSKFVHVDLNAGVRNVPVEGGFFRRDALANRLGVIVSKDHEPVTLTGIIKGFVKYPPHDPPATGTDVTIYSFNGTIDPEDLSKAYIDLPAEAYYYNGPITVAIRNDVSDKKTVLATFTGYVSDSTDGTEGVPSHSLPDDIDQFISYLSQLETDIANVQTAAAQATRVNITQSKTDHVITVQTTGRTASEDRTTTITEPTATLSKEQDGPYTLSVTDATGTTAMTIPDPAAEVKKKVNRTSVTSVKTAYSDDGTVTIDDALDEPAKLTLSLEPKQDLHGYEKPWVGGAGKNLCPVILTGEATASGYTAVVNDDGSITVSGSWTGEGNAVIYRKDGVDKQTKFVLPSGSYILNGSNAEEYNAYGITFQLYNWDAAVATGRTDTDGFVAFTLAEPTTIGVRLYVQNSKATGKTIPSGGVTFYPMIRLASETDPTYEPYSNICPIEGYDIVRITATGKNLLPCTLNNITVNNVVFKKQSDGSYLLDGVASANIGAERFYIGDGYFLKPNTKYVLSGSPDGGSSSTYRLMAGFNNATITFTDTGNGVAFTTPSSWTNFMVYPIVLKDQNMAGKVFAPMIRLATEENSTYEPFGNTLFLNLVSSTGSTVYGGTVTVNEDGSGTLVVDRKLFTFPSTGWVQQSDNTNTKHISYTINDMLDIGSSNSDDIICSDYPVVGNLSDTVHTLHRGRGVRLFIDIKKYPTLEQWKNYISSLDVKPTIVYPLANPSSFPLTTTQIQALIGTNHVWTDSGCEFTLDYRTDKYGKLDEVYSAFPETSAGPADVITITDGADGLPLEKLEMAIEPKQDLHGYDHPWVGGRKNKLDVEKLLVGGSWSGNTYSVQAVGSRPKVVLSSEPSNFKLSYSASSFSGTNVRIETYNGDTLVGSHYFESSGASAISLSGITAIQLNYGNNGAFSITEPMIYLATETDVSYEPYSNICTIDGWEEVKVTRCGKNLLIMDKRAETTVSGIKYSVDDNNRLVMSGKGTSNLSDCSLFAHAPMAIKAEQPITISFSGKDIRSGTLSVFLRQSSGSYADPIILASNEHSATITFSYDVVFYQILFRTRLDQTIDFDCNVQLELGSTPTSYEPYRSTTLPISLSKAGTVYGGTLDVGTGKIVVNTAFVQFNGGFQAANNSGKLVFFHEQCAPLDCPAVKCNLYEADPDMPASATQSATSHPKIMLSQRITSTGITGTRFMVYDTTFATLADFNAFLATTPMQVVYDLATPITYQLSPRELTTLLGTNHIWSDAGQVSLTYRQSPKLIINDLIRRIEALEEGT